MVKWLEAQLQAQLETAGPAVPDHDPIAGVGRIGCRAGGDRVTEAGCSTVLCAVENVMDFGAELGGVPFLESPRLGDRRYSHIAERTAVQGTRGHRAEGSLRWRNDGRAVLEEAAKRVQLKSSLSEVASAVAVG